jgi:hypothetical protein
MGYIVVAALGLAAGFLLGVFRIEILARLMKSKPPAA